MIFLHQVLGKDLAPLQNGGRFVGAKAGNSRLFQQVHSPQNQGIVRGHHRKINGVVLGKGCDARQVFRPNAGADGIGGDAAIAGGGVNLRHPRAFFQAFDNGVLPAAAAYHKNFHRDLLCLSDGTGACQ